MKTWITIVIGVVLIPVLFIGPCAVSAYRHDREAKRFCESLIPHIEEACAKNGRYPDRVDPTWWEGKNVPSLIRTQRFYFARSDGFGFYFKNDMWVFDNSWEFKSGTGWWSYDSNFGDN